MTDDRTQNIPVKLEDGKIKKTWRSQITFGSHTQILRSILFTFSFSLVI